MWNTTSSYVLIVSSSLKILIYLDSDIYSLEMIDIYFNSKLKMKILTKTKLSFN